MMAMAIFKRGRLDTDTPQNPPTSTNPSMDPDAVVAAETKVQDLLGQQAGDDSATPAAGSSATDNVFDATKTDGQSTTDKPQDQPKPADDSILPTLEVHEEGKQDAAGADGPKDNEPAPTSTLPPEAETDQPGDTTSADVSPDASSSTIPVTDGESVAMADVDREVSELVEKLEGEAGRLESEIGSKNDQIKQMQGEIDEANNRKAELDKKVKALRQVVDNSNDAK